MASYITIKFTSKWRSVEADGSVCSVCGDMIFMEQKRLFIESGGAKTIECEDVNLCQSCFEICDLE